MDNFTYSIGNFEVLGTGGGGGGISRAEAIEIANGAIDTALLDNGKIKVQLDTKAGVNDLANKVDKVSGKSLVSDIEITKLEGMNPATYALKSEIPVVPTKVSAFENDANYLTEHQSLAGYATESWVEGKGYLTQHQDISGKADKSYVDTEVAKKSVVTVSATGTSTDVVKYITINGVEKKLAEGTGPTPTIIDPTAVIVNCPDALSVGDTLTVKAKGIKGTYDLLDLSLYFNDVKVNHRENPVSDTEYDLTYDIPTSLANGTYEVKVIVEADGNTSGEATKDIVIGIDVEITECPLTGTVGEEITIKAIPYQGKEPVGRLVLKVNGSVFDSVEDPASGTEYSLKYTPIDSGTNNIKVIANDFFMNEKVLNRDIEVAAAPVSGYYWEIGYDSYNEEDPSIHYGYKMVKSGTNEEITPSVVFADFGEPAEVGPDGLFGKMMFKCRSTAPSLYKMYVTSTSGQSYGIDSFTVTTESSTHGELKVYTHNTSDVGYLGEERYLFECK